MSQLSAKGYSTIDKSYRIGFDNPKDFPKDFSHQVYESLDKCLGCKACVSGCPIKVDIPSMKSQFLANYHSKYKRPALDYFVKYSEAMWSISLHSAKVFDDILNTQFVRSGLTNTVGFVDTPLINSLNLRAELRKRNAPEFNLKELNNLSIEQKLKQYVLSKIYLPHCMTRISQ